MMKFRLYYDKDAEIKWLNKLAGDGWAMKKFFAGFYSFEKCEPGQYVYQIDFGNKLYSVSDDYREFMEDAGVEIIQTWGFWVFLRKPASEGPFELYTDVDSNIEHYSKIRRMFKGAAVLEIICLFLELFAAIEGVAFAWVFVFLIGAILFGIINVVTKINEVIARLKERKGEIVTKKRNQGVSPLLPCGLLLNSCALLIDETVSDPVVMTVQIAAIVVMLAGVYRSARKWR